MKKQSVVVALVLLGLPFPAAAYVRSLTKTGVVTAWKSPCVTMELALGAFPAALDAHGYLEAAQQGAAAWTQSSLDGINRCSNVSIGVVPTDEVAGQLGRDGHNRIIFRQNTWCRDPPPTEPNEPPCYDPRALAITTLFQNPKTGEIVDTDIEVNAVTFTWGDLARQPGVGSYDFQGTITHELGHVLGLDHTCHVPKTYVDGTPMPRSVDNTGTPIPNCSPDNPPLITEATMYVSVSSPETQIGLRTLSPDDAQGVCEIYPYSPSFVCGAPTSSSHGGCSLATRPDSAPLAGALPLAALALVLNRRRRR